METTDINITLPIILIQEMDAHIKDPEKRIFKKRSEYIKDLITADLRQPKLPL